jgi:hypothetical protein
MPSPLSHITTVLVIRFRHMRAFWKGLSLYMILKWVLMVVGVCGLPHKLVKILIGQLSNLFSSIIDLIIWRFIEIRLEIR